MLDLASTSETTLDWVCDSIEMWTHSISLCHKAMIEVVNTRCWVTLKEALVLEKTARRKRSAVYPENHHYVESTASDRLN